MTDLALVRRPFNGLTPKQAELLDLLAEECAEVIQIVSKIKRHGLHSFHPRDPSVDNVSLLHHELGDVLAAQQLLEAIGIVISARLPLLAVEKRERLKATLHHLNDER